MISQVITSWSLNNLINPRTSLIIIYFSIFPSAPVWIPCPLGLPGRSAYIVKTIIWQRPDKRFAFRTDLHRGRRTSQGAQPSNHPLGRPTGRIEQHLLLHQRQDIGCITRTRWRFCRQKTSATYCFEGGPASKPLARHRNSTWAQLHKLMKALPWTFWTSLSN